MEAPRGCQGPEPKPWAKGWVGRRSLLFNESRTPRGNGTLGYGGGSDGSGGSVPKPSFLSETCGAEGAPMGSIAK